MKIERKDLESIFVIELRSVCHIFGDLYKNLKPTGEDGYPPEVGDAFVNAVNYLIEQHKVNYLVPTEELLEKVKK